MRRTVDPGAGGLLAAEVPERYQLLRRVASGGMASVWCAHDLTLGRRVAIKVLSERFAHDEVAVRRFKREARAAAALSGHPHVVTIYDVGETKASEDASAGRAFIVMEYLAGGTVADAVRVGTVTRADAIRWLREAAAALDHAHRRGVLHRDIKLVNLLLDRDRALHVADFGIAQIGTEDTISTAGEVLGTAAYLAPERALGHPATEASDRYSLAVAAFELLVGERPFAGDHFTAVARQHLEQQPPRASRCNRALPAEIDAVLERGMAKRPEERWPTAISFAAAIEGALTVGTRSRVEPAPTEAPGEPVAPAPGEPVGPAPAAPVASAPARPTRPRRRVALAAIVAAALGVGAAALATQVEGSASTRTTLHAQRAEAHRTVARRHVQMSRPAAAPTTTEVQASPASATTPPPTADTLEARGHSLMLAGDYDSAIPILRQAVAAASPSSLTYAYALYDLGRSLRLAGDLRAAATILWRRLQIPNQTDVVRTELTLTLQAIGQQERSIRHGD